MPKILDQYGKPIKLKNLKRVINAGPAMFSNGLLSFVGKFQNPDEIGVETYEQMLDTDETCSYGVEILKLAVMSRLGEYAHPKKEINDFIHEQFERMYGSLYQTVDEMFSAIWAGFSVGEIICDYTDGKVQLVDIQFLHPRTVEFVLHEDGLMKNRVKGVIQNAGYLTGGLTDETLANKFIIYSHSPRFENPYGTSRFQSIYPVYYIKKNLLVFWPRTLEKYGTPTADVTYNNMDSETTITDSNNQTKSFQEYIKGIMNSLQSGTGVAHGDDIAINFLQVQRALGGDFKDAIEYCNKMIFRGLLVPSLVADKSSTGSYSQSRTHFDTFLFGLEKLKRDVTEVLIDQLIRSLITWNFGEQDEWGKFQYKEFKPEAAKLFSEIVNSATNQGYISPQRYEDMRFIREELGLPGISQAEWKQQQVEKEKHRLKIESRLDEKRKALEDGEEKNEKMNALLNGVSAYFTV